MLHKNFKRNFFDKDIIGIVAENRAGKTTVLEAILYNLYGYSRTSKETDLISYNEDYMLTELTLKDGNNSITIKRGRDSKNNPLIELHGIEKKKEVQEQLLIDFGDENND